MSSIPFEEGTHLEHVRGRQWRLYNIFMLFIVACGSLTLGYANGVMATVLAQPSFSATFKLAERPDADTLVGLTNSLYFGGGAIGSLLSSFWADKYGRRWGIGIPGFLTLVTTALLAGSVHIGMFITFRFLSGMWAFMLLAMVPVWISEVAPLAIRGALVNVHNLALVIGYVLASWAGYGFYFIKTENAWRAQFGLMCLPALLLVCGIYWLPESPRWLILQDRAAEAETILYKLHTPEEAQVEYIQITQQINLDRNLETSYLSMFTKPSYRRRVILGFGVVCAVQMAGPLVINNYASIIYGKLGFSTEKQIAFIGGWCVAAGVGAILGEWTIQYISRPWLIGGGLFCCVCCLAAEAGLIAQYATTAESLANPNHGALRAAVALTYIFIFCVEAGPGGAEYVYLSEIFPTHIRSQGLGICVSGLGFMNVIWLQVAPIAFANIGWKFYLVFICASMVAIILILIYGPDTKGLPLENIAALFGDEITGDVIVDTTEVKLSHEHKEGFEVENSTKV